MKSKIKKKIKKISQKQSQNVILNINLKNNKSKAKSSQPKQQPKQQNIINIVKPVAPTLDQSNNKYLLDQHAANLLDLKNKIKNDLIYNKEINANIAELKNLEQMKQRMREQGMATNEQLINLKEDILTRTVVTEKSLRDDNDELFTSSSREIAVNRLKSKTPSNLKGYSRKELFEIFNNRNEPLDENERNEADYIARNPKKIKKADLINFLSRYS